MAEKKTKTETAPADDKPKLKAFQVAQTHAAEATDAHDAARQVLSGGGTPLSFTVMPAMRPATPQQPQITHVGGGAPIMQPQPPRPPVQTPHPSQVPRAQRTA